jgi:hypothetical protein
MSTLDEPTRKGDELPLGTPDVERTDEKGGVQPSDSFAAGW